MVKPEIFVVYKKSHLLGLAKGRVRSEIGDGQPSYFYYCVDRRQIPQLNQSQIRKVGERGRFPPRDDQKMVTPDKPLFTENPTLKNIFNQKNPPPQPCLWTNKLCIFSLFKNMNLCYTLYCYNRYTLLHKILVSAENIVIAGNIVITEIVIAELYCIIFNEKKSRFCHTKQLFPYFFPESRFWRKFHFFRNNSLLYEKFLDYYPPQK